MTAQQKEKIKKIVNFNFNFPKFPEISRNAFLGVMGSMITLFGGGNLLVNLHSQAKTDEVKAKVDSAAIKVDSTNRPRFVMIAKMDTLLARQKRSDEQNNRRMDEMKTLFIDHIDLANNLIPEFERRLWKDSMRIADMEFAMKVLRYEVKTR